MLARALASVAAQTLLPDAVSVALDTDKRGAWHTRQRALDAAQTPWVAFLDSDDEFLPEHLALHAKWAEAEHADFVYAWFELAGTRPTFDPFPEWFFTDPWYPAKPRHTTMTVMVRTELAKSIGFTPPIPGEACGNEDIRFILACSTSGAKIVHIPSTRTWRWWWHAENSSGLPSNW
jgi:glycosyltransferase involved in cell wall biosynthesis